MSEILFEALPPADLTVFARQLAAREVDPLVQVIPNRVIRGRRSRVTRVSRTTTAAKFRSFDAETPIGRRPVAATVESVELAPLGQKLPLRELEILDRYLADNSDLKDVIAALYDDTENNVASILNRALQLRGQFLFTGGVQIEENGFIQEADFGLPADHNLDLADVGDAWSDPDAPIIDLELAWVEQVQDETQETVVRAVVSSRIARAMLTNRQYVAAANVTTGRVTPAVRDAVRAEYGLPPLLVVDAKVGGARVTPDNKIALVTSTVAEFQWGDTAEGLTLLGSNAVDQVSTVAPKITASAWKTTDPVNLWSKANATGLVVAGDINGLFVAEVLEPATTPEGRIAIDVEPDEDDDAGL
ncbi:major capsid protein [Cellulomonas sp.]|uniref:major capsid protein n=1 Tax=Cellulomonas sp. TaxID=40001 RepID=UPI001B22564E|nr:major capsid protein [Cellulomonas sp.]MBO9555600.1 major capsid protein [Cellulomonas sp.]